MFMIKLYIKKMYLGWHSFLKKEKKGSHKLNQLSLISIKFKIELH